MPSILIHLKVELRDHLNNFEIIESSPSVSGIEKISLPLEKQPVSLSP